MTEEDARGAVARIAGDAFGMIEELAGLVLAENARQNLISRSSASLLWSRHILDSAQLALFARPSDKRWADIGSGAGFPGLVIAALGKWDVVLVEPRRRRADFLARCVDTLRLANTSVLQATAQQAAASPFDVISARAVASIPNLLSMTEHITLQSTRFILPRGEHAQADVESVRRDWHGMFHVEQSLTSPLSAVVIADRVRAR